MSINLSNVFSQDGNVYYFDEEINKSDINLDLKGFEIMHPISYKGEIYKVNMEYIINIDIRYTFKTKCDRCLIPVEKEFKTSISATLEDSRTLKQEESNDEDPELDENVMYYNNNILNIEKHILMEILSSLPMQTVCEEKCKGLCPQCGTDLNKETCDCVIDDIDPRLEKLKDFFKDE